MPAFQHVGLVARVASDQVRESLLRVEQFLQSSAVDVVFESTTADMLADADRHVTSLDEMGVRCDLLIAVGGDGNILSAARAIVQFYAKSSSALRASCASLAMCLTCHLPHVPRASQP